MAFIIEDGTGKKGATSYGAVQAFRDYHTDRGTDVSGLADATIQGLLVTATDYIDTRWGSLFLGTRQNATLTARSAFSLPTNALEGETLTFGTVVYTFTATPTLVTDVEIGINEFETLNNLAQSMIDSDNDDFAGAAYADPDIAILTLFANTNGVATTEASAGSFDQALSAGASNNRQPLEFPRVDLFDRAGLAVTFVPGKLEAATYEYALRANTTTLAPDPLVDATGNRVTGKTIVVGPIETETKYAQATTPQITLPYPTADRLLEEYIAPRGVTRA